MRQPLVILGADGYAVEMATWLPSNRFDLMGFFEPRARVGDLISGVRVLRSLENSHYCDFLIASPAPEERRALFELAELHRMHPAMPVIHPSVIGCEGMTVGRGSVIGPGCVISYNVEIGLNVLIRMGANIGFFSKIENHSVIAAGVHLVGENQVREGSLIGANTSLNRKVTVGPYSQIGSCVSVTRDVGPSVVMAAVQPRALEEIR